MNKLTASDYHGVTMGLMQTPRITLRKVDYRAGYADWHHHEQAFFSLVLDGEMTETTARQKYRCPAGTLLFQNWEDRHRNEASRAHTGFYVELHPSWFLNNMSQQVLLRGHQEINHPAVKILFQRIFAESNLAQPHAQLAVEQLLLQALDWLMPPGRAERNLTPEWLHSLDELLHELPDKQLSLDDLSAQLGVHPVHICRTFSQYYHCTLSDYLRKLKVERSLTLIRNNRHTLTEIAFSCGFADQSHFIRCFKAHTGLTPFNYRKLIS